MGGEEEKREKREKERGEKKGKKRKGRKGKKRIEKSRGNKLTNLFLPNLSAAASGAAVSQFYEPVRHFIKPVSS